MFFGGILWEEEEKKGEHLWEKERKGKEKEKMGSRINAK
jgi:hypothetical protein